MDVLHQRRGEREQRPRQPLHLLGHLERRDPVVDQRLVDVEMEQPDLGLGDLADRLRVDPYELEQGDEREAGAEDARHLLDRLDVLVGEAVLERRRGPEQGHQPLDQRLLEPGLRGDLGGRMGPAGLGEQVLYVAEREAALAHGLAELLERVPALAQSGDDPGLRRRRARPAAVAKREHPGGHPALQGRGRDAGQLGGLVQRDRLFGHGTILPYKGRGGLNKERRGRAAPSLGGQSARTVGLRRRRAPRGPCPQTPVARGPRVRGPLRPLSDLQRGAYARDRPPSSIDHSIASRGKRSPMSRRYGSTRSLIAGT